MSLPARGLGQRALSHRQFASHLGLYGALGPKLNISLWFWHFQCIFSSFLLLENCNVVKMSLHHLPFLSHASRHVWALSSAVLLALPWIGIVFLLPRHFFFYPPLYFLFLNMQQRRSPSAVKELSVYKLAPITIHSGTFFMFLLIVWVPNRFANCMCYKMNSCITCSEFVSE